MLFVPPHLFDQLGHISPFTVLHHDEDLGLLFVYYSIIVPDNVRMVQFSKYIDLRDELLLLFFIHLSIV